MKIYTSYFAKMNKFPSDFIPVAICGWIPDFYKGLWTKKVAPKWSFLQAWKQNHDNDLYIEHFNKEILDATTPEDFINLLKNMTNNAENVVLLCYEKPSDFCHRHLVADWINNNTDYEVTEWTEK